MGSRRLLARAPRPTARFIKDNIVLCPHRLLPCHADGFPDRPSGTRLAPAAWPSARQLAGILHANSAAPRVLLSQAGSVGVGLLALLE
jgi:hypothetical protein